MKNNKRWIAGIVLFFMLSCAFSGAIYHAYSCIDETNAIGQEEYLSQVGEISQCISEKNRITTSQLAMLRQLNIRRNQSLYFVWSVLSEIKTLDVLLWLMVFFILFIGTANRSQKFIIHYIHNKDGQKA